MAEIACWGGHKFEVSSNVVRSFSDLQMKGSSETEEKEDGSIKYISRKKGKPIEISLTAHLHASLGSNVQKEARDFVDNARDGKSDYFYVGGKKLFSFQLMLTDATVNNVTIAGNATWSKADVKLTLKQCSRIDGSTGGGGGGAAAGGGGGGGYGGGGGGSAKASVKSTSPVSFYMPSSVAQKQKLALMEKKMNQMDSKGTTSTKTTTSTSTSIRTTTNSWIASAVKSAVSTVANTIKSAVNKASVAKKPTVAAATTRAASVATTPIKRMTAKVTAAARTVVRVTPQVSRARGTRGYTR